MGDPILASLSLPPSGRTASKEPTGTKMAVTCPSDNTQTETSFITPVIGLISNENVPVMSSANTRTLRDGGVTAGDAGKVGGEQTMERNAGKPSGGIKRKQPEKNESDEEGEMHSKPRSMEQRMGNSLGSFGSLQKPDREREKDTNLLRKEDSNRGDMGAQSRPEDPSTYSISVSPYAKWQNQRRQRSSSRPNSAFPALDNKE